MGQRLIQPASDMFLGWVPVAEGKHYYVRQLRDAKIKPMIETFDSDGLCDYAQICGRVLARAHARGATPPSLAAISARARGSWRSSQSPTRTRLSAIMPNLRLQCGEARLKAIVSNPSSQSPTRLWHRATRKKVQS